MHPAVVAIIVMNIVMNEIIEITIFECLMHIYAQQFPETTKESIRDVLMQTHVQSLSIGCGSRRSDTPLPPPYFGHRGGRKYRLYMYDT